MGQHFIQYYFIDSLRKIKDTANHQISFFTLDYEKMWTQVKNCNVGKTYLVMNFLYTTSS